MWRVQSQEDAEAFAQLMHRWQKPIQSLCLRMTGNPHTAEDLAQETFSRLFFHRKSYQPTARFSTFLWKIAVNLCQDELRRLKRRKELPLVSDQTPQGDPVAEAVALEPNPGESAAATEQAALVRAALDQLTEPYRAVVVLRHYEGLKFREIAEVLDVPEGTVKSRMAEALSQLNRQLTLASYGSDHRTAHPTPAPNRRPNHSARSTASSLFPN